MTAEFGFLLAAPDPHAPDPDVLADVHEAWVNEYYNQHCDDSVGYAPVSLVLGSGRWVDASDSGAGAAPEGWEGTPEAARAHAEGWAHTVAIDAGLFGASDLFSENEQARVLRTLDYATVCQMTRAYLAAQVVEDYAPLAADAAPDDGRSGDAVAPFLRQRRVRRLEAFLASSLRPFADPERPGYRAFDVRPFGQTGPELEAHHAVYTVRLRY